MNNLPNLLIVDDSEVNLALLEAVVDRMEVNLIQALSGPEALVKTRGIELALAIIDVRMPGMNGYELAIKLNEERLDDKVPIIFLTAIDVNEKEEFAGYHSGAVDYLFKPLRPHVLQSKIRVFTELFNKKQTIAREAVILEQTSAELKKVNAALQTSEAKYRSYIENAPNGIFIADKAGFYLEVNDEACRMTGFSREELLKMSVKDLFSDEIAKIGQVHFKRLIKTGKLKVDLPYRHKDGLQPWWTLEAARLSDSRYLIFTNDISHRIALEESLRMHQIEMEMQNNELEEQNDEIRQAKKLADQVSVKYTALYDFAPTSYFTLTKELRIQELNHNGATMLEKKRSGLQGSRFDHYVSRETRPQFIEFIGSIFHSRQRKTCEVVIETDSGHPVFAHIEGIVSETGNECLLNIADISERKMLEGKLQSRESNFRTFFETMNDFVLVASMSGQIIHSNRALISTLGYTAEELQEMHFLDLNPPGMRDEATRIFEELMAGKRSFCPLPLVTRNGTLIPVESRIWTGTWDDRECIFALAKNMTAEQEAMQKFNKIFLNNPALIAISTVPEGVFTDVNDSFLDCTGYSKEEIIGKTVSDLNLFIEPDKQTAASAELTRTGSVTNLELEIRTKTGEIRNGLFSGEIIESHGSKYFLTVMIDVTDRKQAENIIKNSESSLAEAQRIAQIGSWEYDFNTGILKCSKELFRVWDLTDESDILNPEILMQLVHPDDLEMYRISTEQLQSSEYSSPLEFRIIHRDGSVHNLFSQGSTELNADGKPVKNVGTVQDVTERKKAELIIKISEEKYRTILNSSPDGILLIDLQGVITEVSEIGVELFGAETRDDLVGKNFYEFVPPEGINELENIFEKTLSDGLAQNFELTFRKKNQTVFAGEFSSTLIQDNHGVPFSFMFVVRDISHRKKMETKQMHADRMANLGEMAAGIAHEINQPLNIISMVMDKILFESAKTEVINVEFLTGKSDKIFENILRIRNIIDHIRAFSRSHDNFVRTAFDINQSIENATSLISEQFKHLGIELRLKLNHQIPQLVGNTYQFEQVIINLLTNAKDAVLEMKNQEAANREMVVEINSFRQNETLVVEITDNGIGISGDDLHNIMLPFYTTKEEGKGTGLGLSICYQIIGEMGGTIDISSEPGKGTKIKIILQTEIQHK